MKKKNVTASVSIEAPLLEMVEEKVRKLGFKNSTEYLAALIQRDVSPRPKYREITMEDVMRMRLRWAWEIMTKDQYAQWMEMQEAFRVEMGYKKEAKEITIDPETSLAIDRILDAATLKAEGRRRNAV